MSAICVYAICFLDALSLGLMLPFFSPQLLNLGANHTVLGIFASLHVFGLEISRLLANSSNQNYNTKTTLIATMTIGWIVYLAMGAATTFRELISIRLIFDSTNQTLDMCKAYSQNRRDKDAFNIKLCTLGVLGFIIGPAIAGNLFESKTGFYDICLIASIMTAFSCVLTLFVDNTLLEGPANAKEVPFGTLLSLEINNFFSNLQQIKRQYFNIVLIKFLMGMSLTTITIKFPLLLLTHYDFTPTHVGYMTAFQSFAIFVMSFLVPVSDRFYGDNYAKKLFHFLPLLAIFLTCVCYAPTYMMYVLSYIPLCFIKSALNAAWKDMSLSKDVNLVNLSKVLESVDTFATIITPLLFGYACDLYGHYGVKVFTVVPALLASYISTLSYQSMHYKQD